MQLLTRLQFDICYVIKTRVGFEIVEIKKKLNYTGSYSFALKNSFSENFRKFKGVCLKWSYLFTKLLNVEFLRRDLPLNNSTIMV